MNEYSGMDVPITSALVTQLVAEQFPQWAGLRVQAVEPGGVDNRTFRLGEALLVRLPSGEGYAAQVEKEQRWLPMLATELPLPIPEPVAQGKPSLGYPFPWSVYRWIDGVSANQVDASVLDKESIAVALARFLKVMHQIDTPGAVFPEKSDSLKNIVGFPNPGAHNYFRGAHPSVYDDEAREHIKMLGVRVDERKALAVWEEAMATSWQGVPVWVHGDVAAGNVLVDEKGELAAVIDFGCMGVGDPACDLTIAWTFFEGVSRTLFQEVLALDADTWARARGWALWKACVELVALEDKDSLEGKVLLNVLNAVLA